MARMSGNYSPQTQAAIRRRATEIYHLSGAREGHDVENWYQAEAEILRESATTPPRRAVVVNLQGVVYTGEYEATSADGTRPANGNPALPSPSASTATNSTSAAPTARNSKPP
jgi:hypothetical protein